ncbi:MAG: hypothetical protein R2749_00270 [Acidimicrobiales bacterium]
MTLTDHTPELDELDIHTARRYVEHGYPWQAWDLLREYAPVYRYERPGFPPFWAVTRYEDVHTVHSNPEVFINEVGPSCGWTPSTASRRSTASSVASTSASVGTPDASPRHGLPRPARALDLRMLTMRRFTPPRCGAWRRTSPISPPATSPRSWSGPGRRR